MEKNGKRRSGMSNSGTRMIGGAYQPRSRSSAFADTLSEARSALGKLMRMLILRGAGLLVLVLAFGILAALLSYDSQDISPDNASGADAENLLGPLGATAADLLLRYFGLASFAFLLPMMAWGGRAFMGWPMSYAVPRAFAWLAGTILTAGGLGILPSLDHLPASCGGLIGIIAGTLSGNLGRTSGQEWLHTAIPLLFLVLGLVSSVFAANIRLGPLWRAAVNVPVFLYWLGLKAKDLTKVPPGVAGKNEDVEEDGEDEEEEVSSLDVAPEPLAHGAGKPLVRRESQRKTVPPKRARQQAFDLGGGEYRLPALELLVEAKHSGSVTAKDESLEENARMLVAVLSDFGVKGRIEAVRPGPVVTLYEFEPAAGVKSSRVIALSDDVARSMSAVAARIAVIPGRNVLGIELPNLNRETVYLRELLASSEYEKARSPLILALGKTIGGEAVMTDLAKMPHLLIAGTTGSGKSVALNTMILSLLYRMPPDQCRMILIDPKMLELSVYDGIPHLLAPVVTDPKKAVVALKWAVREMEERYRKMSKLGVRGVEAFNDRVRRARDRGETLKRTVQTGFDRDTGKPVYEDETLDLSLMPFIVVVVDEMADLMMISGKEIEGAVQRLAQMARAAGIHLIAATQRPSVDVITGTIKANFPTRISFQVTSKIDSRTILGEQGAEQLLGMGDMLYMMAGGRIRRVHGPFVTDSEVEDVVRYLKTQGRPDYLDAVTEEPEEDSEDTLGFGGNSAPGDDLYDKALSIVARERKASTSYIQRRLQIGYNRAARLIERMEKENVVSKPNHKGVREVLLPDHGES
jgi:DNA segregation ATPase FtsK/SpoIIIE, S-DNA-T family